MLETERQNVGPYGNVAVKRHIWTKNVRELGDYLRAACVYDICTTLVLGHELRRKRLQRDMRREKQRSTKEMGVALKMTRDG